MKLPLWILFLGLLGMGGCTVVTDQVSLYGYLFTTSTPEGDSTVLPDADLFAYDLSGNLLAEGYEPYSNSPGYYRIAGLPASEPLVVVSRASADYTPTVLRGATQSTALYLDNGELYILPADVALAWVETFAEADPEGPASQHLDPDLDANGGFLVGSLRDSASWEGTRIEVEDLEGTLHPAFYMAPTGLPDPSLTSTSADGRFAVFALPSGPVKVWFTLPSASSPLDSPFQTLAWEDGVTSLLLFQIVEETL